MSGFYELKCMDWMGFYTYYYFYSPRAIRNPKMALNRGYASDAMRLVVDDREENPIEIRPMHNIFEYIYKKYFKKAGTFRLGYRVDWEKERKKILKEGWQTGKDMISYRQIRKGGTQNELHFRRGTGLGRNSRGHLRGSRRGSGRLKIFHFLNRNTYNQNI